MNRRVHRLERSQLIPRRRDEVFAFFADASNLQAMTPPFLRFRILSPLPIEMRSGARIEYSLSLGGVPLKWRTRITEWEPGVRFVDEQETGPYALWRHTHRFEDRGSSTLMRDLVEYVEPLGPLGLVAHVLFVKGALDRIFDFRRQAIQRRFGPEAPVIVAFGADAANWHDISDPVMGGISSSQMVAEDGVAVFKGVVSLENSGGFASVRSAEGHYDLSGCDGLTVRVRGDGKSYGLRLRTSDAFDGVNYQVDFTPVPGAWLDVNLPFAAFQPVLRGRQVAGHPPLAPAAIRTFGLIIAARQEGPFRLELQSIAGYSQSQAQGHTQA